MLSKHLFILECYDLLVDQLHVKIHAVLLQLILELHLLVLPLLLQFLVCLIESLSYALTQLLRSQLCLFRSLPLGSGGGIWLEALRFLRAFLRIRRSTRLEVVRGWALLTLNKGRAQVLRNLLRFRSLNALEHTLIIILLVVCVIQHLRESACLNLRVRRLRSQLVILV